MIALDTTVLTSGVKAFLTEYQLLINVGTAFGVLSGILAFIILLMQLSANSDNPQERGKILKELFFVGISTSLLGSITFVVQVFYSVTMIS